MFKPRSARRVTAVGLGLAAAVSAMALPLLTSPASADVAPPAGTTIQATTSSQTNVAPNGPLTNLTDGSNIHLVVTGNAGTNNGFEARICNTGLNITGNAGFVPLQGKQCALTPLPGGGQVYSNLVAPDGSLTTATYDLPIGTGTETFATPTGNATVTCTFATPCALWLKLNVGPSTSWVHYDLNFQHPVGVPDQPAAPTASLSGTTATLNWTAPGTNPAIDNYIVTPYIGGVAQAPISTGSTAPTYQATGLGLFSNYTFTVTAHNAQGNSLESAPSSPAVTPVPATPAAPNASSSASGSADVTFTAQAGATSYVVTPFDVTTSTAGTPVTVAGSPASFTGLVDGDTYTFSFHAVYAAGTGTESPASAPVKIGSKSVQQVIIATRPQGTLDIAEACANGFTGGTYGNPPLTTSYTGPTANPGAAAGPQYGQYPQTCDVNLGTGVLNASATYYVATGSISTVNVRDLRDGDLGWHVTTQITTFAGTLGGTFSGACLAFTPQYTESSNTALYTQRVHVPTDPTADAATTGTATAAIGGTCAGAGLSGQTVETAAVGGGLGVAALDGALTLNIPTSAPADTYAATLTFTAL